MFRFLSNVSTNNQQAETSEQEQVKKQSNPKSSSSLKDAANKECPTEQKKISSLQNTATTSQIEDPDLTYCEDIHQFDHYSSKHKENRISDSSHSNDNNRISPEDNLAIIEKDSIPVSTSSSKPALSSMDLKKVGNKLCALNKYEDALSYYTLAISRNPNEAVFYSNRALCNLKLQRWHPAAQDCRLALDLNPNLLKAYFFLGQALAELENFDDALKNFQKAHELAKEKKLNFGDDIAYQIRLTKRRRWNKIEETNDKLEDELRDYLIDLIRKDTDEKLSRIRQMHDQPQPSSSTADSELPKFNEFDVKSKCDNYLEKLHSIFKHLEVQRRKRDVPDYLCGKISFEIMQDPVITPSGITYDRQDIQEHLRKVGHFDPVTRQLLRPDKLISNLVMKEVIDAYLQENEWAKYY